MEFQFGTNWATFSRVAGGVIGQGLMMEGMYAFFLESAFLGLFLFGEKRVSPRVHWFSALMVAVGSVISSYFIMTADAFMQHPVAYRRLADGRLEITSLWGYLTNPYLGWGFLHTVNGALVTACMVMTALGAYYLLVKRHTEFARVCLTLGLIAGFIFSLTQVFPTGAKNGETVTKYNPIKLAAMEGQFKTDMGSAGASLHPLLLPALGRPGQGLNIYNAAAPQFNLVTAALANVLALAGVILYSISIHRIFGGKMKMDSGHGY